MRRLVLMICLSWILLLAARGENVAGQQTVRSMGGGENGLQYLLYLPEKYGDDKQWPLVVFLHGSGERGTKIDRVKKHGPPKLVAAGRQFPFILVSPQCPRDQRWNAQQLGVLISQLEAKYSVDKDRIYVTGLSMGATGTWALVASEVCSDCASVRSRRSGDSQVICQHTDLGFSRSQRPDGPDPRIAAYGRRVESCRWKAQIYGLSQCQA